MSVMNEAIELIYRMADKKEPNQGKSSLSSIILSTNIAVIQELV